MAALNRPATGTVTNHARKMFLKRRQSTAFWERIQPTATTEPTWRPHPVGGGEKKENISGSLDSTGLCDRVKSCRLFFRGVLICRLQRNVVNAAYSSPPRSNSLIGERKRTGNRTSTQIQVWKV